MTDLKTKAKRVNTEGEAAPEQPGRPAAPDALSPPEPAPRWRSRRFFRIFRVLITLVTAGLAVLFAWRMWDLYMGAPWTRDGTVRAYVVTMAPEIAGRIVELPVRDNQFVHKGDLLMVIDPTNYKIAVEFAEAAEEQAKAMAINARAESERREKLDSLAVSDEVKQTFRARE